MQKTIYQCDRCGKETASVMRAVFVEVVSIRMPGLARDDVGFIAKELCDSCYTDFFLELNAFIQNMNGKYNAANIEPEITNHV